jgi:ABC-type multidrug transport system fused ATPase/permease subunit
MNSIEFKNFSFRYLLQDENEQALKNLTFEVQQGSVVGVIGRAGPEEHVSKIIERAGPQG